MATTTVEFASTSGFHARPAAVFVKAVVASKNRVTVANAEGQFANGASLVSVMSLGIQHGQPVTLTVTGDNEDRTLGELVDILSINYDA